MAIKKSQRDKIIKHNFELAQKEALDYEKLRPEIFCDCSQTKLKQALEQAKKHLPANKKLNALDLGCGTGNISIHLVKDPNVSKLTVVDLSLSMLGMLRKKVSISQRDKMKFFYQEIDEFLKEDDKKYDIITFGSVLSHLPDYQKTVKKAFAKLQPGGVMLIHQEPTNAQANYLKWLEKKDEHVFFKKKCNRDLAKKARKLAYKKANHHQGKKTSPVSVKTDLEKQRNCSVIHFNTYSAYKSRLARFLGKMFPEKNCFSLVLAKK